MSVRVVGHPDVERRSPAISRQGATDLDGGASRIDCPAASELTANQSRLVTCDQCTSNLISGGRGLITVPNVVGNLPLRFDTVHDQHIFERPW